MVPRSDDEKMFGARLQRGVCEMIPVIRERTQLVAVVLTCDCENRQRDLLELLARGQHRVVVSVGRRVLEYELEIHRRISHERIERFEREMLFVSIQEFRAPEFLIAAKIVLRGS